MRNSKADRVDDETVEEENVKIEGPGPHRDIPDSPHLLLHGLKELKKVHGLTAPRDLAYTVKEVILGDGGNGRGAIERGEAEKTQPSVFG